MTPITSVTYQGAAAHRKVQMMLHSLLETQLKSAQSPVLTADIIWHSDTAFVLLTSIAEQNDKQYNAIYHRISDTSRPLSAEQIHSAYHRLQSGGQLLIERVDFTQQQAYPYSAAFARY